MDDDARLDYQRQLDDERRFCELERERYFAAHPGYEQCPNHPARPVVDSSCCNTRFCAECIGKRQERYVDQRNSTSITIEDLRSAWIYRAGDKPTSYLEKDDKK